MFGGLARAPAAHGQEIAVDQGDHIVLNASAGLDLAVLVDYVGTATGVRFAYSEELKNQRIELRPSPVEVPKTRLLPLLSNLLRLRDLVLVEQAPGFYRIVKSDDVSRSVTTVLAPGAAVDAESLRLVAQVVTLPSGKVDGLVERIGRFISSPRGGVVAVPERGAIIVTDYESRIALIHDLLATIEAAAPRVEVRAIPVAAGDPSTLAAQVSALLAETTRARQTTLSPPTLRGDLRPGAIVVVGLPAQIDEAQALIEQFSPLGVDWRVQAYRLTFLEARRAKELIERALLGPGSGVRPPAAIEVDSVANRLFVTAEASTHTAIAALFEHEDQPLPQAQRPLRVYRPRNRKAAELIATVGQLLGAPAATNAEDAVLAEDPPPSPSRPPVPPSAGQSGPTRLAGKDFVLIEDEATNAILAIGSPEFHVQLQSLLGELDRRRPQVMIEMKLVAVTQSDSMDLGVELQSLDLGDAWDFLVFSSFGLSNVDVVTGQRVLEPGIGANGVLLSPDRVPILVRALATRGLAEVVSTARILVSDNARGILRNVDEAPFTSVNASDTVATTSFAGFESAGTTLGVTPHILEGDFLTLEYELSFSNFTGSSSQATVPPPRTTNSFNSTVEVPDGYTVITGGLVVDNHADSTSEVPLLGQIPGLGKLFQSSTRSKTRTRVYAFIRPVILREDKFEDLKFISLKDIEELPPDDHAPAPQPMWMK